jgi:hypothetical protein
MTIYHIPGNTKEIDELYVFLSKDENGEGIIAGLTEHGAMPLVFSDEKYLKPFTEFAKEMAKKTKQKIVLCKFKKYEIIEEIG